MIHCRRSLAIFQTALLVLSGCWVSASATAPVPIRRQMQMKPPKEPVSQLMNCGFWRTDHTFEATMHIKNELLDAPLSVTPILFMADGTEFDLTPTTVGASQVSDVDINAALASAPPDVRSHVSDFGSASLRFEHKWTPVSGMIEDVDKLRSLVYQAPLQHVMGSDPGHQTVEGLWWKHDAGVGGFIGLSNATTSQLNVFVQVSDSNGSGGPQHKFSLAPRQTQLVQLSDLDATEKGDNLGGVTISFDGQIGDLLLSGGLENSAEGFSAPIMFRSVRQSQAQDQTLTYASTGIMVGTPDPMMGFPARVSFQPFTILRNADSKPISVQPTLLYTNSTGTKEIDTPAVSLGPHHAGKMDVASILAANGLANLNGNIDLQFTYKGNPGALLIATGSVDQTGTYVFDVWARGVAKSRGQKIPYWQNSNGNDSMISILNPTTTAENLLLTIYYSGGSYKLPFHLDPHASTMVDIGMLAAEQTPDKDGHVFPTEVGTGSALVTDAAGRRDIYVVTNSGTFNVEDATCGGEDLCSPNCLTPEELNCSPSNFGFSITDTQQLAATMTYEDNSTSDDTDVSSWSSNNTSAVTMNSSTLGLSQSVDIGTANLTASETTGVHTSDCYTTGICDEEEFQGSGGASSTVRAVMTIATPGTPTSGNPAAQSGGQYEFAISIALGAPGPSFTGGDFTVTRSGPISNPSMVQLDSVSDNSSPAQPSPACHLVHQGDSCTAGLGFTVSSISNNAHAGTVGWNFTVSAPSGVSVVYSPTDGNGWVNFH